MSFERPTMTIPSSTKLSKPQLKLLSEIVELTDDGFIYLTHPHHKRVRTLRALERRDLITLRPPPGGVGTIAAPTPHGRFTLHKLQASKDTEVKFREVQALLNQLLG
jgi:hypothetical protein